MITFVTGIPGSGKGIVAMRYIREDLLASERTVVTNLPIRVPEFNEYLQKHGFTGDINERLRILNADEVFEFFRYRPQGVVLERGPDSERKLSGEKRAKMEKPEFVARMHQIFERCATERLVRVNYHIDEAHNFFDAREWADTGRELGWYASQHRHLEDNVVFYSQNPEQVEGRLRMLAAARWEVRNFYQETFGPFKRRGRFQVKGYYRCPKTLSGEPFKTETFPLDKDLASCYRTTGAITPTGEGKPEEQRKIRGLPWWSLYGMGLAAVLVICVGVWFAPRLISAGLARMMGAGQKAAQEAVATHVPGPVASHQDKPAAGLGNPFARPPAEPQVSASPRVWVSSYSVFGSGRNTQVVVRFSSGLVVTGSDPDLQEIETHRVRYAGVWYPIILEQARPSDQDGATRLREMTRGDA